jgi:hypothetical protein
MGASHSEPEITLEKEKDTIESVEPVVDPDYDSMYELPEIEMDWFWPFI